jgi:hypothetical protein
MPGSKVTRLYSPNNKVNEKQVQGGKQLSN